jgi:hypothetical protein
MIDLLELLAIALTALLQLAAVLVVRAVDLKVLDLVPAQDVVVETN